MRLRIREYPGQGFLLVETEGQAIAEARQRAEDDFRKMREQAEATWQDGRPAELAKLAALDGEIEREQSAIDKAQAAVTDADAEAKRLLAAGKSPGPALTRKKQAEAEVAGRQEAIELLEEQRADVRFKLDDEELRLKAKALGTAYKAATSTVAEEFSLPAGLEQWLVARAHFDRLHELMTLQSVAQNQEEMARQRQQAKLAAELRALEQAAKPEPTPEEARLAQLAANAMIPPPRLRQPTALETSAQYLEG